MKGLRLKGLVAATHTPFSPEGELNLAAIEPQMEHLLGSGIRAVFIGGSTGECHSLTREERRLLGERWLEASRGTALQVLVHVGSNSLEDAAALAAHAEALGAAAIAALAPSYFKPADASALVECCARIASAAPNTPFYYYDIPALTGLKVPVLEFLGRAEGQIPNLAGIKYTHHDLATCQECLRFQGGGYSVLWGNDEGLLAGLALGVEGAVGSTYNFAAVLGQGIMQAYAEGDMNTARERQFRLVSLVRILERYGYMAAAKSLMTMLGVPVGRPRLPLQRLGAGQEGSLEKELEGLGFFNWIDRGKAASGDAPPTKGEWGNGRAAGVVDV